VSEPATSAGRDRHLALLIAVALLLVLGAPWYRTTVIVTGIAGRRHGLAETWSGWQALSTASVVCAIVALATIARLLIATRSPGEGLGAAGRRAARTRIDGALVAGGGAIALLLALLDLTSHPGPRISATHGMSATGPQWGLMLALALCVGLVVLGVRIARAGVAAAPAGAHPAPRREPRRRSARARS
jgi:hypothetical protein